MDWRWWRKRPAPPQAQTETAPWNTVEKLAFAIFALDALADGKSISPDDKDAFSGSNHRKNLMATANAELADAVRERISDGLDIDLQNTALLAKIGEVVEDKLAKLEGESWQIHEKCRKIASDTRPWTQISINFLVSVLVSTGVIVVAIASGALDLVEVIKNLEHVQTVVKTQ